MTPEDLAQIAAVIAASEQRTNAAIAASEQRINASTAAAIAAAEERTAAAIAAAEERTAAAITAAEERIIARQEGAVESIAIEFSTLRVEIKDSFQAIERRLDRVENLGYSMNMQTTGMNKSIGDGERLMSEILARQSAQQQAFFELQIRVDKIERKLRPEQP